MNCRMLSLPYCRCGSFHLSTEQLSCWYPFLRLIINMNDYSILSWCCCATVAIVQVNNPSTALSPLDVSDVPFAVLVCFAMSISIVSVFGGHSCSTSLGEAHFLLLSSLLFAIIWLSCWCLLPMKYCSSLFFISFPSHRLLIEQNISAALVDVVMATLHWPALTV